MQSSSHKTVTTRSSKRSTSNSAPSASSPSSNLRSAKTSKTSNRSPDPNEKKRTRSGLEWGDDHQPQTEPTLKKKAKRQTAPTASTSTTTMKRQEKSLGNEPQPCPSATLAAAAADAMHNEEVLSTLARILPSAHLRSLRRTCRQWHRIFTPVFRAKHAPVKLLCSKPKSELSELRLPWYPKRPTINDYLHDIEYSPFIPYSAYTIVEPGSASPQEAARFLELCARGDNNLTSTSLVRKVEVRLPAYAAWEKGSGVNRTRQLVFRLATQLTSLRLSFMTADGDDDSDDEPAADEVSERHTNRLIKCLPNLHDLTIDEMHINDRACITLITDILRSCPQLECLEANNQDLAANLEIVSAFSQPSSSVPWRRLVNLNNLKLYDVDAAQLRILVRSLDDTSAPCFRLVELHLGVAFNTEDGADHVEEAELLRALLISQSKSLRELALGFVWYEAEDEEEDEEDDDDRPKVAIEMPSLPRLKQLTLGRGEKRRFTFHSEGSVLNLEEACPALTCFQCVLEEWDENADFGDGEGATVSQLAHGGVIDLTLRIGRGYAEDQAASYTAAAALWPNVTSLFIVLTEPDSPTRPVLPTAWPSLRSLEIRLFDESRSIVLAHPIELDEFLSGVPSSRFNTLKYHHFATTMGSWRNRGKGKSGRSKSPPTMDTVRSLLDKFKTSPGLSDFTQLQEFVLCCGGHRVVLTDIGGYLGLAMANSSTIQRMGIQTRGWRAGGLSTPCRELIRNAFHPNAVIELSN